MKTLEFAEMQSIEARGFSRTVCGGAVALGIIRGFAVGGIPGAIIGGGIGSLFC